MLKNIRKSAWTKAAYPAAFLSLILLPNTAFAQENFSDPVPTYADLVDFADPAEIVLKAQIRKQAVVEPERSPGLAPGFVRLYIEAETLALISGNVSVGESLKYLVDVPLTGKGKAPKLRKKQVLLFASPVIGSRGAIQLSSLTSQLLWTPDLEARLRPILTDLVTEGSPPAVTGIRDGLSIDGNLAGESETQIFFNTDDGSPLSISVIRRPAQTPVWGVSWSDIVDQAASPPAPATLEWYRLACFLPRTLPASAFLTSDTASRARTQSDYRFVLAQLGECSRSASIEGAR